MKTMSAFPGSTTTSSTTSSSKPEGYAFWGVTLTDVPSSTSESDISSAFKKYGDIFSIKAVSEGTNIIFKSPKQPSSMSDIMSEQSKFKVTPLASKQLPATSTSSTSTTSSSSVAKISLLSAKTETGSFKPKFTSKLSRDAPAFQAPSRLVHTSKSSSRSSSSTFSKGGATGSLRLTTPIVEVECEGVFFEAVCKSITHGTSEEEVHGFMKQHIYSGIKDNVKDDMMMMPGKGMAVFEVTERSAIRALTAVAKANKELKFNGHRFTLRRKDGDGVEASATPETADAAKGLSLKINDEEVEAGEVDKNGVDYLMGFGFQHGIAAKDEAKQQSPADGQKNFYFKLPEEAKGYVTKQGEALEIPKTAFVLMLGVLTTNGPIPIGHYHDWKRGNPNATSSQSSIKSTPLSRKDITSNIPESTRSTRTTRSSNGASSPVESDIITPTPAVTALFDSKQYAVSAPSKQRTSATTSPLDSKRKKVNPLHASTSAGSLLKPMVSKGSLSLQKSSSVGSVNSQPQSAPANKGRFQYPQTAPATNLFSGNSQLLMGGNNQTMPLMNGQNMATLISPRCSLIQMKGVGNIMSPPNGVVLSPRANNNGMNGVAPAPVVVPNGGGFDPTKQNVGTGFAMTTPIANLTPVHIPYLAGGGAGGQQASPMATNSGFQSPINYNINTPQSPLGNYPGITPIINAFTPTANGVNAITPTTSLPFYWSNLNGQQGQIGQPMAQPTNQMGAINMDNDPLAPQNNMGFINQAQAQQQQRMMPKFTPAQQQVQPPMQQPNGQQRTDQQSPKAQVSTFFKYPIPAEEPKSSPSGSNHVTLPSLIALRQQQSGNNFGGTESEAMNGTSVFNGDHFRRGDMDGDDDEQMNEQPSLEIDQMRQIPSVISPNGTTPVVMITNLNEDEIDCDKIFTLCGVFGDVQRVKISYHKRDTAFVQLSNHRQAKHVVTSLNRMQLYGKMIHVNLSRMTRVKLPKDSPNSAMMFPDAKFLTKDYTNCKRHRYSKKGAGGIKYSPLSIGQPSHILHIANLPIQSEAKDLQEFLCGVGNNSHRFRGADNDKIQSIELIGVNNKLGSCQAFAKCHSVDIACQILIDYHSQEFLGREIKISFATRSHMPSDINKTHKTYSYSTARKPGASINSIPTSIPRQMSSERERQNSGNSNADNMSSSSSSNGGHVGGHGGHGGHVANGYGHGHHAQSNGYAQHNGHYSNGGMERSSAYGSRYAQSQSHGHGQGPARLGGGYGYQQPDNGYQTYVVNGKQQAQQDDKIFVRQHHHSGGRKYHYKLRINK